MLRRKGMQLIFFFLCVCVCVKKGEERGKERNTNIQFYSQLLKDETDALEANA